MLRAAFTLGLEQRELGANFSYLGVAHDNQPALPRQDGPLG